MIIKTKSKIHPTKNLHSTTIESGKSLPKKIWFFRSSLYQIAVIDTSCPYPYTRISSENHIQYFTNLRCGESKLSYLMVVNSIGVWVAYLVKYVNKGIQISLMCESVLRDTDSQVVGCHLIQQESLMLIFVKQDGKLEYNYLTKQVKLVKTLKVNKMYEIQQTNDKYHKSNLFSKYLGKQLLQVVNENNIIESAYKANTKQLLVITEDINSKIYSIIRVFIQDYEVMTGMDLLLNLPYRPIQIITLVKIVVVNLGFKIIVWAKNIIQHILFVQDGMFCNNLTVCNQEKLSFVGCFVKNYQTFIYLLLVNLQTKDQSNLATYKFQKIVKLPICEILLNYTPLDLPNGQPAIGLNSKLEVVYWQKDGKSKIILPNMQATILSAVIFQQKYSNYMKVVKKVGNSIEEKIITNNRIVVEVDEYQHNMLLKMAHCLKYCVNGDKAQLYFCSPIIGTLKLAISFAENQKTSSPSKLSSDRQNQVVISSGSPQPNLITDEQSLYLELTGSQQITPTKLFTTKSKYSISQLFQGSVDFILAGCIVGGFALLLVEKQVHVFLIDAKPKRLHIYCFDCEVKAVIGLNGVNLWGAVLWDGSFHVLRIHEKQSIKIREIQNIQCYGLNNSFSFNIYVNTAPHTFTIVGNHLLICSNDPLHIYQPQKTSIKLIKLNEQQFGQHYYPVVDMSHGKGTNEKYYTILSNIGYRWIFVNFLMKYLVKDVEEIKVQVEEILGFPEIDHLLGVVVKDQVLVAICSNKISVLTLNLGNITYKTSSLLLDQVNSKEKMGAGLSNLKRWLRRQEISYSRVTIQNSTNIWETDPTIIKMSSNRVLLYDEKQVWYGSLTNKTIKLISYFSMPNDAFIEFRNNLGIHQLQNNEFMKIFAEKLPIIAVQKISQTLFAVLFSKMVTVVQIDRNEGLVIKQTLPFTQCIGLISITQFIGNYDQKSIYMRDCAHRLVLLKYNSQLDIHKYEIKQQLQDELVRINRVRGWRERSRKIRITGDEGIEFEEMRVKRDGQMVIGNEVRQSYI